jgi:cytochrome c2
MNSKIMLVIAEFLIGAIVTGASAQDMGDPQKGHTYARMVCAECHAVEKGQAQSPNPKAPSFSTVAATSGMTELALRVWLQTPHPTMPNLLLKASDRDDLVAYVRSLNPASL